jgi:hypothetical protein
MVHPATAHLSAEPVSGYSGILCSFLTGIPVLYMVAKIRSIAMNVHMADHISIPVEPCE